MDLSSETTPRRMLGLGLALDMSRTGMEEKRVKIKYHQGYDPTLGDKLSAVANALGGEFNDRPVGDGVREMSFNFENDEELGKFVRIFKELQAEKEEDQDKNSEDV